MRLYQCFKTKEERSAWERKKKKESPTFRVCMHYPVKQLRKELHLPEEVLKGYVYATVYTTD